jgi:hypothetical protein
MISEEKLVILIGKIIPDQQLIPKISSWTLHAFRQIVGHVLTSSFNCRVVVHL